MGIYLQKRKDGSTFGSYVIDRVIKGNRYKLSTGTKDKRTARRMDDVIEMILDAGLDQHLRHLRERKITIRQLYELNQQGKLHNPFHNPAELQPLEPTLSDWIAKYSKYSDRTRKTNTDFLKAMYKRVGQQFPTPQIRDVADMLRLYRRICDEKESARTFNITKAIFTAFLRETIGKRSDAYQLSIDVSKLADKPKNPQTAKSPAEIEKLTKALPAKYRGMVWTMCTAGVGWLEYGQLTVKTDELAPHIHIAGTKMRRSDNRRDRKVPLVMAPACRVGSDRHFRKVLVATSKRLGMTNVNIYTFRKCYANWLAEAKIPRWRISKYLGHEARTQTEQYEKAEVERWLIEDAAAFGAWLTAARKKPEISMRERRNKLSIPFEADPIANLDEIDAAQTELSKHVATLDTLDD